MKAKIQITISPAQQGIKCTAKSIDNKVISEATSNASGVITLPVDTLGEYNLIYDDPKVIGDNWIDISAAGTYELTASYSTIVTYKLKIDTSNSNPLTSCEYDNDGTIIYPAKGSAQWDNMPIFNEIKPCVFKKW